VEPAVIANVLETTNIDLAKLRETTTPSVRALPSVRVDYVPTLATAEKGAITAPNVFARFGGEGKQFTTVDRGGNKREVDESIVITAHMDGVGAGSDDAGGVAALIEVARAVSEEGGRPRRSVVVLATSGSEQGFWGSTY